MGKVKKFLSNYQNNNTYNNHRKALTNYFTSIYGKFSPDQLDEMGDRYFTEQRDIEQDLQTFMAFMNKYAPLTQRNRMSSVRTFLMENNFELPQKFWKKLLRRIKGSRALTLDKIPSNKELRKILTHMSVHGKSLFLLLESSGMRIGEASKLKLNDLMLDEEPMRIQIRGEYTKTGNSRYAFASREAKEAITEWLKVRTEYLKAASGKSHKYGKSAEDDRLFPFRKTTSYIIWHGALKKAKLDQRDNSTNVRKLHPHVLRKFFRTRLGAVIPVDVVEALMGHEGYLTEVYRRYTVEDLAKFYLQGESALLVFTDAAEVTKLRQEVEEHAHKIQKEVDERNRTLQSLVNGLTAENLEVKSKVAKVELENTKLNKRIQKTEDKLTEIMLMLKESLKS
jgi:integrase